MSPAGVLFATFAVLMLLGSPITVALGVAPMAALYTLDQNLVTLAHGLSPSRKTSSAPSPAGSPSPPHWPACFSGRFPVPAPRRPPPWGCL